MIERISPPGIAAPRGPYSPAVRAGDFIFVSGQVAVDPATQQLISGDIAAETRQVLNNIKALLEGCGATLADVKLMRKHAPAHVQVKAAGGVRDLEPLLLMRAAGCTRCGASRTKEILDQARQRFGTA